MELFNSLIKDTRTLLENGSPKSWDYSERDCWTDIGSSELVLQKDAAYDRTVEEPRYRNRHERADERD